MKIQNTNWDRRVWREIKAESAGEKLENDLHEVKCRKSKVNYKSFTASLPGSASETRRCFYRIIDRWWWWNVVWSCNSRAINCNTPSQWKLGQRKFWVWPQNETREDGDGVKFPLWILLVENFNLHTFLLLKHLHFIKAQKHTFYMSMICTELVKSCFFFPLSINFLFLFLQINESPFFSPALLR